ncbi:MAG: TolC family protein [Candidatus Omnitrophota bacterium]
MKKRPTILSRFCITAAITVCVSCWAGNAWSGDIASAREGDLRSATSAKEDLIKKGKDKYASRDYEGALNEWEAALSLDPKDRSLKKYIGQARKKIKRRPKKDKEPVSVGSQAEIPHVLTLDDCIKIAVQNHMPLKIAEDSIKLGEMRLWEARRNMLPTATIKWQESSGRVNDRRYIGRKQSIEGQQAVFHGGELYFVMKQAETNLKIVTEDYNRIKNDLILQVKKGYYTLAKAKESFKMQDELKREVEGIYGRVSKGSEAGIISKLEFLNVSSQHAQTGFQFASAEGDLAIADLILKQAMNVDQSYNMDIDAKLGFRKVEVNSGEALMAAFMNRPEVRANSLMVEYYNYEKGIARAKGWPKVDLMGSWGLAKEEYAPEDNLAPPANSTTLDDDRKMEQEWYLGFKASMPFWGSTAEYSHTREQWQPVVSAYQGTESATQAIKVGILDNFRYYSGKQEALMNFHRAQQELTKIKQDVTLEVRESCFSYAKALLQLDTAEKKIVYQEKDLELMRFKRGLDEAQDSNVIESLIKFYQEKFGHIQALVDCHISLAAINKAIGVENYFKDEEDLRIQGDLSLSDKVRLK